MPTVRAKPTKKILCKPVSLPTELLLKAAQFAKEENPNNAPDPLHFGVETGIVLDAHRLAMVSSKRWSASGVDLSVQFTDTSSSSLRNKILEYANLWKNGGKVNVNFRWTQQTGDIRVATTPGDGHYSYLGTDCRLIPKNQKTMNLDSFTVNTPDSEYLRVVCHEFGHALGFPHEHLRRAIVILLDPNKTITSFYKKYGWGADTTRQQVLIPIEESTLFLGTSEADVHSIMCYEIDGDCTYSGKPIPGGTRIDPLDFETAAKFYPGIVAPPPPPISSAITFPGMGTFTAAIGTDGKPVIVFTGA